MSINIVNQILLDQFRVEGFVASGGMGTVYRVWDLKRNVPLAMKVLHTDLADDPSILKRFKREARALEKLAHPNIIPFYGLHQTLDFAFLVERFIDGPTLEQVLRRREGKPLPVDEALVYLKALSSALGYAHNHGVVHCDVKPGNVMVDQGGSVYLTDFGVARHAESTTTTLGFAGTAAYMAPEQIRGEAVTAQTDVYALGVMLYEMLTGRRPFRGDERETEGRGSTVAERVRYAHMKLKPPDPRTLNPALPVEFSQVVLKALSKAPEERYRSARVFFEAICDAAGIATTAVSDRVTPPEALSPRPIEAPRMEPVHPLPPSAGEGVSFADRRTKLMPVVIGVIGVLAMVVVFIFRDPSLSLVENLSTSTNEPAGRSEPTIATPTKTVTPIPTSPPQVEVQTETLARSAGGRSISMVRIGSGTGTAIVVVGSIDGYQTDTRDAVNRLIGKYNTGGLRPPTGVTLYLIPSINPDGNTKSNPQKARLNANGVDLNRNWDTPDWTTDPPLPGWSDGKPDAGGPYPMSEPEISALADLLQYLKILSQHVYLVVLHSSVNVSGGIVFPGYTSRGIDPESHSIALRIGAILIYDYDTAWEYDTPGEAINWAPMNGIPAVDILWPRGKGPSTSTLAEAISSIAIP
ncbi:MAG: protein kinase [Anaerolineales bacterium]|nr:protein kinase [Anaerolineales bacterium]